MSDAGRKPAQKSGRDPVVKGQSVQPQTKLETEDDQHRGPPDAGAQIEAYLQRKSEVTQDDHQAFQDYLSQKTQLALAPAPLSPGEPAPPSRFNRRNLLKVVAGTA